MSEAYDQYLNDHIAAVQHGWIWMKDHLLARLPEKLGNVDSRWIDIFAIDKLVAQHDQSKTRPEEYPAYDAWFYGPNKSYEAKQNFQRAFLEHIHVNPHHWQYWVLIHDDPGEPETLIEMPINYIFEMICDWWSFSWRKGDLYEIFNWYDTNKSGMRLNKKTQKIVETILFTLKMTLDLEKDLETAQKMNEMKESDGNGGN